ncbi:DUF3341 domain-containing protein, partial [Planctomycetota bacterium]|nr:DUF3341 domain-containing protein [Planctomycetota bacterium]
PGLFNSVTASIGFLAFLSARMEVVKQLGVFAGIGIALAFGCSLLVCALVADTFPRWLEPRGAASDKPDVIDRGLHSLANVAQRRRVPLLLASAAVFAIAIGGIFQLRVDSYSLWYFYDEHRIRQDDERIFDAVGPYIPLEFVLRTDAPEGVYEPTTIAAQQALIDEVVESEPTVARAIALSSVLHRIHRVYLEDPAAPLPDSRPAIEQEMLFYDPERPDDPVQLVRASEWNATRFTFKIKNEGARAAGELLERIDEIADTLLPEAEEPKAEEPKAEEPKSEEPKAEEPAPVAEESAPAPAPAAPKEPAAILLEFENTGTLMAACERVRDSGWTKWDAHTPFPVHGLDKAMGVKATILPWIVLGGGLSGGLGGLFLQLYTNGVVLPFSTQNVPYIGWLLDPFLPSGYDYVVSGKPVFSVPANIPVTFETTVLLSAFAAFFGMLILNGLPRFNHPVFKSARFRRATDDRFFISLEAKDPNFDPDKTLAFANTLGAANVEVLES